MVESMTSYPVSYLNFSFFEDLSNSNETRQNR